MADSQLEFGAQTRAAQHVGEAIPDIAARITQLATDIEATMSGFEGQAAAGFLQALQSWFEAANALPEALSRYATNLATVDQNAFRTDAQQQAGFNRWASKLGGIEP